MASIQSLAIREEQATNRLLDAAKVLAKEYETDGVNLEDLNKRPEISVVERMERIAAFMEVLAKGARQMNEFVKGATSELEKLRAANVELKAQAGAKQANIAAKQQAYSKQAKG